MRTSFATAERACANKLEDQIKLIAGHPVVNKIIDAVHGVFAVCNEYRQILAVNESLLKFLGIDDPASIIGQRPGEAFHCIHSHRCEGGCGTSEYCRSCGAAIAMVLSLTEEKPIEKTCSISVNSVREKEDFFFLVRSTPMKIEDTQIILLTMQNITKLQNLQFMERMFLHDVSNLATAISGLSEFASDCDPEDMPLLLKALNNTSSRLINEIKLQSLLISSGDGKYLIDNQPVSLKEIFDETVDMISGHSSITGKKLRKPEVLPEKHFATDKTLVLKVLQNMLINAFEATDTGRAVRFWVDCGKKDLTFCVWNHKSIPEIMQKRIFQRNFTTKDQPGHGLGTYSMKVFGEKMLDGRISFETSEAKGTVFRFTLPLHEIVAN
jgi:signal transduction histidine kinase